MQFGLVALFAGALWAIIIHLGGFRLDDLKLSLMFWRFPPSWFAGIMGCFVYTVASQCLREEPVPSLFSAQYLPDVIFGVASVVFGIMCAYALSLLRPFDDSAYFQAAPNAVSICQGADSSTPGPDVDRLRKWLEDGEGPIGLPSDDLFESAHYARRIADFVVSEDSKTLGIYGPRGRGKTSIINLTEHFLKERERSSTTADNHWPKVKLVRLGMWGSRAESNAHYIISSVIRELQKVTDCLCLNGLTLQYSRALSAVPSGWGKVVSTFMLGDFSAQEALGKLEYVLSAIQLKLVIVVDDFDRGDLTPESRVQLEALLDRLKPLKYVSFILVAGHNPGTDVLTRLCDHVEIVPRLKAADVISNVRSLRRLLREFDDIDALSSEKRDERFGREGIDRFRYLWCGGALDAISAIAQLVDTPRAMKAVFMQTYRAWKKLHGELDFDDLLICKVLKVTCPEIYSFLLSNVDALRLDGGRVTSDNQSNWEGRLVESWEKLVAEHHLNDSSVKILCRFLFPSFARDVNPNAYPIAGPQGVDRYSVTDYWFRLHSEWVGPSETRDQGVLRVLRDWRQHCSSEKEDSNTALWDGKPLPEAVLCTPILASKLRQFGEILSEVEIVALAKGIFAGILKKSDSGVQPNDNDYFGFIEVRDLYEALPGKKDLQYCRRWLHNEIVTALKIDLRFAIRILKEWGSVLFSEKDALYQMIREVVENIYANEPCMLAKALSPNHMDCLSRLIELLPAQNNTGNASAPDGWKWLGDVVLSAAKSSPERVVPSLVGLLFPPETDVPMMTDQDHPVFGSNLRKAMEIVANGTDTSCMSPDIADKIRSSQSQARRWLENPPLSKVSEGGHTSQSS
ncbi:MAG: hypothetical protein K1Y02_15405 [Candidatus Hydrogenedentes bacterium]|nr:hypothetical protein [Candidatus Hydrogenedentota bacterium]